MGRLQLPRRWRVHGGVFLLFVVLALLLFRSAWASPRTTWIGAPGDPPLFMWYLRWLPWALAHGHNPLFTDHMNFPDGVNLMWNTAMPGPALLLTPLTLTIGPVATYNVLMTGAVAMNGWVTYLVLTRVVTHRVPAVAGGCLYAFSPYVVSHAEAHPNLPLALFPPLLGLVLAELLVRQHYPATRVGALLGLIVAVQLLSSEELVASSFLITGVGLLILMGLHRREVRERVAHAARGLAVAAVVAVALAGFPLAFQFFGPQRVSKGALWGPDIFVSDVLTFVIPTGHQWLHPVWAGDVTAKFTDACCPAEWNGYLGAPLLLMIVVVTVALWRRPLVRFVGLMAAVAALFSMGPHLHVAGLVTSTRLPFELVGHVPVLRNLLAERLMLYGYLAAAVLLAVALDALAASRWPRLGVAGLAALTLVPLVPATRFPATRTTTPPFFSSAEVKRIPAGSVVLVAPFARDTSTSEPMLWQAVAGMRYRMPAGYALGPDADGRFVYLPIPTDLSRAMEQIQRGAPVPDLTAELLARIQHDLRRWEVRSVLVGPMANRETMIAFFTELLGRRPRHVQGVDLWLGVGP